MPYCLACGRLRDTLGGRCEQCRLDEAAKAPKREDPRRARDREMLRVMGTLDPLPPPRRTC